MSIEDIVDRSNAAYARLQFTPPWVYNPWDYAQEPYLEYWHRYGQPGKDTVLMGMNPGPWGMAQTGVPFGEVSYVRDWLEIRSQPHKPHPEHPKRPIMGFACTRSEVSGQRFWGTLQRLFVTPERFFARHFVANYCPLIFMEESGRNVTPDKLPRAERDALLRICDEAIAWQLQQLGVRRLIGVGKWAESRGNALNQQFGLNLEVISILHPSPANPLTNRGWGSELEALLEWKS